MIEQIERWGKYHAYVLGQGMARSRPADEINACVGTADTLSRIASNENVTIGGMVAS